MGLGPEAMDPVEAQSRTLCIGSKSCARNTTTTV